MRSAGTSANVTWLESLLVRRVSHFLSKGPSVSSVDLIFLIYRVEQKMLLFNHLGQDLCILTTRRNSSVQKEGNIRTQNEDGHLESGAGGRLLGHMLFSQAAKETNSAIFTFQLSMFRNSEEHNSVAKAAQTQGLCCDSPGRCRSHAWRERTVMIQPGAVSSFQALPPVFLSPQVSPAASPPTVAGIVSSERAS